MIHPTSSIKPSAFGRAPPSADLFHMNNGGSGTTTPCGLSMEPQDLPPNFGPRLQHGSSSFIEISSLEGGGGGSQSGRTSRAGIGSESFELAKSNGMSTSLSSSGGWLHGAHGAPVPLMRRGSQTGGFGSLNFDSTDSVISDEKTSTATGGGGGISMIDRNKTFSSQRSFGSQNSIDNDYFNQNGSQLNSQDEEIIQSTPDDPIFLSVNTIHPSSGSGSTNSQMASSQDGSFNIFTPKNNNQQGWGPGGGRTLSAGPVYNGPTRIFLQNGEIPSRKTVEFQELFELGRGQFGSVSCCRKRTDGVNYAIKRQALDRMSPAAKIAAKREVYALSALPDCPNLVRYYDAWYEDNETLLFVQMEFLPGGTLLCLAERHVLTEDHARRAIRDIARALSYMHEKGIGHLDVKPENILSIGDVNNQGFKLGDLGHATLLDVVDGQGGTMMMNPEEGDRSYLLECMPDDFYRDVDLDKLPTGAEYPNDRFFSSSSSSRLQQQRNARSELMISTRNNRNENENGSSGSGFFIDEFDNSPRILSHDKSSSSSSSGIGMIGGKSLIPFPTPKHSGITSNLRKNMLPHSDGSISSSSNPLLHGNSGMNASSKFIHPLSNNSVSSYQMNSNNDLMFTSNTSSTSLPFYSDGSRTSVGGDGDGLRSVQRFHQRNDSNQSNDSLSSMLSPNNGSTTPNSAGAFRPLIKKKNNNATTQGEDSLNDTLEDSMDASIEEDGPMLLTVNSPPVALFGSQHQTTTTMNSNLAPTCNNNNNDDDDVDDMGLSIPSPSFEDETSIGSPVMAYSARKKGLDQQSQHQTPQGGHGSPLESHSEYPLSLPTPMKPNHHHTTTTTGTTGTGGEGGSKGSGRDLSQGPNKNGHAPWLSPEIVNRNSNQQQQQNNNNNINSSQHSQQHRGKQGSDSQTTMRDPISERNRIASMNRAIYLAASDVFALGIGAYEVARMAERPEGYRVPTNGKEYSDLREGLAPPMVLSAMSPSFSKSFEDAVLDVIKPRSYRNRPTAADVLLMFSDPLIEQRFNSSSQTSLPPMPPPAPRGSGDRGVMQQELTNLRKRVRELESALNV